MAKRMKPWIHCRRCLRPFKDVQGLGLHLSWRRRSTKSRWDELCPDVDLVGKRSDRNKSFDEVHLCDKCRHETTASDLMVALCKKAKP